MGKASLSTMNQQKAADLQSRSALRAPATLIGEGGITTFRRARGWCVGQTGRRPGKNELTSRRAVSAIIRTQVV